MYRNQTSVGKREKASAKASYAYWTDTIGIRDLLSFQCLVLATEDYCFYTFSSRHFALEVDFGQILHCSWLFLSLFWSTRCLSFTVWCKNFWKWKIHLVIFQKYYYYNNLWQIWVTVDICKPKWNMNV